MQALFINGLRLKSTTPDTFLEDSPRESLKCSSLDSKDSKYDENDTNESTTNQEDCLSQIPANSNAIKMLPSLNCKRNVIFVPLEEIDVHEDVSRKTKIDIRFSLTNLQEFKNIPGNLTKDSFSDIRHLCNGSHSNIYKAKYNEETVILKALMENSLYNEIARSEFNREIAILSRIKHPHIAQLVGFGDIANKAIEGRPLMAIECLNGDTLAFHLSKNKFQTKRPFTEGRCLRMAKELAHAIYFLHDLVNSDCLFIHRDLKPDNIGFTKDGTLKLMDFGLCISIKKNSTSESAYQLTGFTGSLRYMAPEVALSKPYNEKVDVYGFGLILYSIFTGVTPFMGMKKEEFMKKVVKECYRPDIVYDDYGKDVRASGKITDLMTRCWDPVSSNRPSAKELYETLSDEDSVNRSKLSQRSALTRSISSLFSSRDSI